MIFHLKSNMSPVGVELIVPNQFPDLYNDLPQREGMFFNTDFSVGMFGEWSEYRVLFLPAETYREKFEWHTANPCEYFKQRFDEDGIMSGDEEWARALVAGYC